MASAAALPASGNHVGDGRLAVDTLALYVWDGDSWEIPAAGSSPPMGPAGGDLAGSYPNPTVAPDAVALGTDTTGPYAASTSEAGPATTATALAADPADCISGLPRGVDASGAAAGCAAVAIGPDTSGGYAGSVSAGGPATTATALAADGSNCSAGDYPLGIDAAGNAQTCTTLPAGITAHSGPSGLSADDHTQYALLAGRSGGQALIGGTGAANDLTLTPTSHATKGRIVVTGPVRSTWPYSAQAPQYSFAAEPDTGMGFIESGKIIFGFTGTNTVQLMYNAIYIERDDGQIKAGPGPADVALKRTATAEWTVTNAGSSRGSLVLDQLKIPARATAPTCGSTPALYVDSDSNTLCYCNGSAWSPISGAGSCT